MSHTYNLLTRVTGNFKNTLHLSHGVSHSLIIRALSVTPLFC